MSYLALIEWSSEDDLSPEVLWAPDKTEAMQVVVNRLEQFTEYEELQEVAAAFEWDASSDLLRAEQYLLLLKEMTTAPWVTFLTLDDKAIGNGLAQWAQDPPYVPGRI